jgi:AGZA family xanthine/uracil permease-like MFS transporter
MMMRGVLAINWNYPGDSIPAFVTLMFMPFSYSIAYGLIAGIMCFAIINTFTWALGAISGGRLLPPDYDNKEYWSFRSDSPRAQPWFIRAMKGDKKVWRPQDTDSFELESTEARIEAHTKA